MAAFIELIAKIKQKNNGTFKLVDAQDVECDEGKGLDEVLNEKLDKNQGVENTNKVLVTDAEGNVVTQDKEDFEGGGTTDYNGLTNKPSINGVELSGNKTSSNLKMYTQEEVNYLLDDKMDKPHYDLAIGDDTTIENTLSGNFKIKSIEGSIFQKEESNIVPTPERPIPIRSKKIKVGEEYVELRSLKESVNIFSLDDFYITKKVNCTIEKITNGIRLSNSSGVRDSYIELDFSLKANKTYTVSFTADTTNSSFLDVVNCKILSFSASYWANPNWSVTIDNEKGIKSYQKTVTPTVDCKIYLCAMNLGISEQDGYVDFTNIMLVEGDSAPSSYVAPTVRDYKIVDHTNKTSKIVRNVKNIDLSSIGYQYQTGIDDKPYRVANYVYNLTSIYDSYKYIYANSEKVYKYKGFQSQMENGLCVSEHGIMRVVNGVTNEDELKTYVDNNRVDILYALAIPTEESIPYLEDDTSEVGYSWQDTTSPSPDIKSEIYEVDEINIKLVGKNLLNKDNINIDSVYVKYDKSTYPCVTKKFNVDEYGVVTLSTPTQNSIWCQMKVELKQNTKYILSLTNVDGLSSEQMSKFVIRGITLYNENNEIVGGNWDRCLNTFTTNEQTAYAILALTFWQTSVNTTIKFKIQVEEGSVATTYESYQETSIQHTLSKPLRGTKDGSVRDIIDIVNMQTIYKLKKDIFDGSQLFGSSDLGYTDTTRFNIKIDDFEIGSNKEHFIWCDKLKNKNGDIPNEEYIRLASGTFGRFLWFYIIKNRLNDISATSFRKWLKQNPLTTIYQLETPITEPLEDELVEKLKTLKTFSPVTHVFVEGIAKPKLNTSYPKDIALAQQKLEQKIVQLQEMVIKNV